MKILNGRYCVKVKDHRYKIHPTENIILGERDPSKSPKTQHQVQNEIQIRKNQKVIEINNDELLVENYPRNKKQPVQQPKYKPPNCVSCKLNNWLEFDKGYYCQNCEYNIKKQKHQIDKKKVRRQYHYFSTRLPCAIKKIREVCYSMVDTTYNSTQDMITNLQSLKGKTK